MIIVYRKSGVEVFDFSLAHSQNAHDASNENNLSIAVSVDNNKLLTTVFKKTIMPPPMSNFELTLPSPILAFSVGNKYVLAVCEESLDFF